MEEMKARFGIDFTEPSTWKAVVWLLTSFGIVITPDQEQYIAILGMMAVGLLGLLFKDNKPKPETEVDDDDEHSVDYVVKKSRTKKK
jgi:hypothetical protein